MSRKKKDARKETAQFWLSQMKDSWALGPRKIFWADEKVFRIGEAPRGNQNFRIWVDEWAPKQDVPSGAIQRGEGAWQGGARLMVALGARWRGVGTMKV